MNPNPEETEAARRGGNNSELLSEVRGAPAKGNTTPRKMVSRGSMKVTSPRAAATTSAGGALPTMNEHDAALPRVDIVSVWILEEFKSYCFFFLHVLLIGLELVRILVGLGGRRELLDSGHPVCPAPSTFRLGTGFKDFYLLATFHRIVLCHYATISIIIQRITY
jgi:hypothetical protein